MGGEAAIPFPIALRRTRFTFAALADKP